MHKKFTVADLQVLIQIRWYESKLHFFNTREKPNPIFCDLILMANVLQQPDKDKSNKTLEKLSYLHCAENVGGLSK